MRHVCLRCFHWRRRPATGFAEALKLLADEWMEQGVEAISLRMKVLNGFSIITLALVIGWLVTGFFGIQQEIAALTRSVH